MSIMKLGVNMLNFGAHATPEAFAGWARFAEEAGFDFVMVSDHLAVTPDVAEQYPAPFYDPFTVLAWLAGTTERIGLGTTVTVLPYRHPLQLARVTANLDRLSGGRLIFGVGVGWARREYAALDVPFERRGALADEYLEVILRSWTRSRTDEPGRGASGPVSGGVVRLAERGRGRTRATRRPPPDRPRRTRDPPGRRCRGCTGRRIRPDA